MGLSKNCRKGWTNFTRTLIHSFVVKFPVPDGKGYFFVFQGYGKIFGGKDRQWAVFHEKKIGGNNGRMAV